MSLSENPELRVYVEDALRLVLAARPERPLDLIDSYFQRYLSQIVPYVEAKCALFDLIDCCFQRFYPSVGRTWYHIAGKCFSFLSHRKLLPTVQPSQIVP